MSSQFGQGSYPDIFSAILNVKSCLLAIWYLPLTIFLFLLSRYAQTVGLNQEEYEKMKTDPAIEKKVGQDLSEGWQAGVRGTPAVFINAIRLRDRSLKGFQVAIDKRLEELGRTAAQPSS